jgi:uncharacterized YigZ family protein
MVKVLLESATNKIEIKKSKFITTAIPIKELAEIKPLVNKTKKDNPAANHVVHAAIVGSTGSIFSLSDDGEPKNTSARPMLEVLKGSGITNILLLTTRYFGGTKLGTGGLVKAYGDGAKEILNLVKTEELIKKSSFILTTSYDRYETDKLLLQRFDCSIDNEDFATEVTITGTLASSKSKEMEEEIINKSNARDEILFEDIPL